jgi:uncharacterized protein (DUF488 family)
MKPGPEKTLRLLTIGHSSRTFEDFLSLLTEFNICVVADIRRYPGSRKFPHFNRDQLRQLLDAQGIHYIWLEALGGRRHTAKNNESPNAGLKSPGFRSYADYMTTDEFRTAVRDLLLTAAVSPTAIMCAEKFYWKCHRRLLSDYLTAQGVDVEHIAESGKLQPHKLSRGTVITADAMVSYPSLKPAKIQAQKLF